MNKNAFSLVELSIVLVILGLLVGGVLSGQSLIRAAELRNVGTEFSRYQTAFNIFRDKYFDMAGDMPTATTVFGRMTTDSACWYTAGTTVTSNGVCNGTGNGQIDTVFGGTGNIDEKFQVWRHLAAAGLIEGGFTGRYTAGSGACDVVGSATTNCPPSKLGGGAQWQALHFYNTWNTSQFEPMLVIGAQMNNHNSMASQGVLSPEEAWNIDSKLDDGIPGIGILNARSKGTCWTGTGNSAVYALSTSGKQCFVQFKVRM